MLVITRRPSESIIIGDNIEVIISDITGDKVKVCINAPREITILRKELLETSKLNKEASISPERTLLNKIKDMLK